MKFLRAITFAAGLLAAVAAFGQTQPQAAALFLAGPPPTTFALSAPLVHYQVSTSAVAQTIDRLGATFSFDLEAKGKDGKRKIAATPALTYKIDNFTNVLGKGFNLDFDGLLGTTGGGATFGAALVYSRSFHVHLADQLEGVISALIGPSYLYATANNCPHLGFVAGVGFKF